MARLYADTSHLRPTNLRSCQVAIAAPHHPLTVVPDFDTFAEAYTRGHAQVLSTRLVADLET
ncbi:MAG: hypothetical protein AAGG72_02210, partial [Pseudomonadota bacterium]